MATPRTRESRNGFIARCMACATHRGLSPIEKAERCYGIWTEHTTQKSEEAAANPPAPKDLSPAQIQRLGKEWIEDLLADWPHGPSRPATAEPAAETTEKSHACSGCNTDHPCQKCQLDTTQKAGHEKCGGEGGHMRKNTDNQD